MVDYRELLKRYMDLVVDREGTDYLDTTSRFTPDEAAELATIAAEVRAEEAVRYAAKCARLAAGFRAPAKESLEAMCARLGISYSHHEQGRNE